MLLNFRDIANVFRSLLCLKCMLWCAFMLNGCFSELSAQLTASIDTINIIEVEIVKPRLSRNSELDSYIDVPKQQIVNYQNQNLSELLAKTTFGMITSSGYNGGIASIRLRGGGSNHTSVLWNGLPVNSLTTGGADLSMLNVGAFDQIKVINGAAGAKYGSGTLGGAVELNNIPSFKDSSSVAISGVYGSFETYKARANAQVSNNNLSYSGQLFFSDSKNNFTFEDNLDHGTPEKTMQNADVHEYGTIHNLGFKIKQHLFNVGLWYQFKDYNIPPVMGPGDLVSTSNQKDSTFKAFLNWKHYSNYWRLEALSGFINDELIYTNNGVLINEIGSKRHLNSVYAGYSVGKFCFETGLRYNYLKGKSYNYFGDKKEHELGVSLNTTFKHGISSTSILLSKEWNSVTHPPIMFAFASQMVIVPQQLDLRFKVSSHYRRPTFNERYWEPGGNQNLKSERGVNGEVGLSYVIWNTLEQNITIDETLYTAYNQEMLMWVPDDGASKPINTGKVKSLGSETKVSYVRNGANHTITAALLYGYGKHQFNDADASNYKEILYYKPKHLLRAWATYSDKIFDLTINNSFQSDCTTPDGYTVDRFFITDIMAHVKPLMKYDKLQVSISVHNVFNTNYQLIYQYAQPRRNYSVGLSLIL